MSDVAPTLPASRGSLPPEGAAAPAVWQSQSRGPCLKGKKRRLQGYVPVSCAPCASLCISAIKFSKLFLGQHD